MPRSAADREFGFREAGLLRILTAADPAEVLKAMEALGITFQEEASFLDILRIALGFLLGPVDEILMLLEDADVLLEFLFSVLPAAHQLGPTGTRALNLANRTKALRNNLQNEKNAFQDRIQKEQERIAVSKPTSVI